MSTQDLGKTGSLVPTSSIKATKKTLKNGPDDHISLRSRSDPRRSSAPRRYQPRPQHRSVSKPSQALIYSRTRRHNLYRTDQPRGAHTSAISASSPQIEANEPQDDRTAQQTNSSTSPTKSGGQKPTQPAPTFSDSNESAEISKMWTRIDHDLRVPRAIEPAEKIGSERPGIVQ